MCGSYCWLSLQESVAERHALSSITSAHPVSTLALTLVSCLPPQVCQLNTSSPESIKGFVAGLKSEGVQHVDVSMALLADFLTFSLRQPPCSCRVAMVLGSRYLQHKCALCLLFARRCWSTALESMVSVGLRLMQPCCHGSETSAHAVSTKGSNTPASLFFLLYRQAAGAGRA